MVRHKVVNDKIQAALSRLKDSRTEKEVELIDLVSNMYDSLKEAKKEAVEKMNDTVHSIDDSVHEKPWHYIGGAALGGFLLGILFRRH
jgi:ElaB/YqjD/DUF883 family membrane-anchored ribosome-binding protein